MNLRSNPQCMLESKGIKRDVHLKFIFRDLKKKIFNELLKTQSTKKLNKPLLQCSLDEWKLLIFSLMDRLEIETGDMDGKSVLFKLLILLRHRLVID